MIKRANVIIAKSTGKYIINPVDTMSGGGGIGNNPYLKEHNLSSLELFEKILYVLGLSRENVARPEDWKSFEKEFFNEIGIKTKKTLYDGTVSLSVYTKDNIITFSPYENKGSKQGFQGLGMDQNVSLPFNSPREELLEALELALSRCK